ncbi:MULTISPECIES: lysylphosphatidylglycerol synthase transmembrane domain-containing protein [Haloferax]|uniref:Flippase-like domain-containing protein n=2 Tax=Haloferax TaxID=2251 RepID=A0A6G1Z092_9EURY|nr:MULTISPECIES: lysylphosphatidylglycerol synthase transmembrane domain-containing protein [Haloferax]KAB1187313.1 flippase-like domain-containing protein [Haloferax sp. CBA1149]MRW79960.1 flippase-like domain-containing protein [Haloferax marinisediminis]
MARENIRATLLGFAAAFVVFAVLFYFAGVDELVDRLTMASPALLAALFAITLVWLVAWGTSLKTVLGVLGVDISVLRSFLVFTGAMFSNNITPFGQAGGEPVTALLISRSADTEYETGLAAIASVDTINFVPSITIALIGVGYYATEVTLGRNLEIALVAVVGLAIGVPTAVYIVWERRYELERKLIRALTPVIQTVAQYIPRVSVPSTDGVQRRINGFFRSIERVGRNPRGLAIALGLSGFGWLCQMVGLWTAFHAIGAPIAFSIALFVVPIGAIAGVTPLPGGAGGIEWTLAILVAAASPAVGFDVATAGVVLFRGFVYWVPTLLGGIVMGLESARGWRS